MSRESGLPMCHVTRGLQGVMAKRITGCQEKGSIICQDKVDYNMTWQMGVTVFLETMM